MMNAAAIGQTDKTETTRERAIGRDYWLVCSNCLWSETAYSSESGIEWPPEVVLEQGRASHRRCGGTLKIFAA